MAVFEAATIIRAAPWFTVSIFVWSILSGLLGGKHMLLLRSLHGSCWARECVDYV